MGLSKEIEQLPLKELAPDRGNPRFAKAVREQFEDDDDVFILLAKDFDALSLAESISQHGYFASEPMIVTKEEGREVVLEGNRRLTALNGLVRPELRAQFDKPEKWDEAAEAAVGQEITLDLPLPTIRADERSDADAAIGFRHIGSVLDWSPLQRAQFLAYLVDERGQDFEEVADSVGEEKSVVRLLYRNQSVITEARALGEEEFAQKATARFGIFTSALNRTVLRDYVGVRPNSAVVEREPQLEEQSLPALRELSSWLYGTDEEPRVIGESRELRELAAVVSDPEALVELQRTRNLESAYDIARRGDEPDRVMTGFARGVGHIRTAASAIELIAMERKAVELSEELDELTDQIHHAVQGEE